MKKSLSDMLAKISPSMTLTITAKTKELKKQGMDVISFGAGEPDFDVADVIKEAAIEAIKNNHSRYTDVAGIPELREAISRRLLRENNLTYAPNEIIVTSGAKHALFTALQALLSAGDEVIIPAPYWVSYSEMAKIAGGNIVVIPTKKENRFVLQPEELTAAITPHSKVLMLNNPSNPTGTVYNKSELQAIADICLQNGIYILSDEIYDRFVYDGISHISTASLSDEIKEITITINGLSKTYAMPGWRVGYAAADKEIIAAMSKIQGHCVSHTSSVSQYAAVTALTCNQDFVSEMLNEYAARREYIKNRIDAIGGLSFAEPSGAFYLFVDVSAYYGKQSDGVNVEDSLSFCDALLTQQHVAVIPGIGFGNDNFVRISYACNREDLKKGLARLETFLQNLRSSSYGD